MNHRLLFAALGCGVLVSAGCNKEAATPPAATATPAAPASEFQTNDQRALYAMGFISGQQFSRFKLTPAEFAIFIKGMEAASKGSTPAIDIASAQPLIEPFLGQKASAVSAQLAKGIKVEMLTAGTGASPVASNTVKVHYEGKLENGTVFDSSKKRGQPVEFQLGGVIPCWTQGLQQMKVGGKAKLTCPAESAYGAEGRPPVIPPNSTLIFEVELLEIK